MFKKWANSSYERFRVHILSMGQHKTQFTTTTPETTLHKAKAQVSPVGAVDIDICNGRQRSTLSLPLIPCVLQCWWPTHILSII